MKTILRFEFNDESIAKGFLIPNPPVFPLTGEIVDIEWEHYITDREQIERLNELNENYTFIAEVLSKRYSPKEVVILVILHRDDSPEVQRLNHCQSALSL